MTEREIKRLEKKCYECEHELNKALAFLGNAASAVLGYDVVAELCVDGEIEFRTIGSDGIPNDFSYIRMEDVLTKINR